MLRAFRGQKLNFNFAVISVFTFDTVSSFCQHFRPYHYHWRANIEAMPPHNMKIR